MGRTPHHLEAQALTPFTHPKEMGLPSIDDLLRRIQQHPTLASVARRSCRSLDTACVAQALSAFMRTLRSKPAPIDEYLRSGTQLSLAAQRGWALFTGEAGCSNCHAINASSPLFTDERFHAAGLRPAALDLDLARIAVKLERGTIVEDLLTDRAHAALGRYLVTGNTDDIGKFRTPSLRNVSNTAPYMHDGSIASLYEALEYELYYRRGVDGQPIVLTPNEKQDLVALMNAFSSCALSCR
ncbi:MAG: hypothetical protein HC933_15180 [Pleurocapsa sp. SU_196_0]|nr:hypothetical protein [Pleurocapsa sp. SU_196_0]